MRFTAKTRGWLKRDISLLLTSMGGRSYGGFYQNQKSLRCKGNLFFTHGASLCAPHARELRYNIYKTT